MITITIGRATTDASSRILVFGTYEGGPDDQIVFGARTFDPGRWDRAMLYAEWLARYSGPAGAGHWTIPSMRRI
jgi:hypothetical protein